MPLLLLLLGSMLLGSLAVWQYIRLCSSINSVCNSFCLRSRITHTALLVLLLLQLVGCCSCIQHGCCCICFCFHSQLLQLLQVQ
jgi:hypothetical protein